MISSKIANFLNDDSRSDVNDSGMFGIETRRLIWERTKYGLIIGIILIPLFSFLDYFCLPELAQSFLYYRIGGALSFAVILFLLFRPAGQQYPLLFALIAYLLAGCMISLMIVQDGGYDSYYYVGLLMLMITFSVILPLNITQTLFSGVLLFTLYIVPILTFNEMEPGHAGAFANNVFFFIFFIVIITVLSKIETQTRVNEFNLKQDLHASHKQLAFYAHNLEEEVDHKAEALEKSELRYKELYNNIIDMVIIIDRQGSIIKANSIFLTTMGVTNNDAPLDMSMFLPANEQEEFQNQVLYPLWKDGRVQNLEFSMQNRNGQSYKVECNAMNIELDEKRTGFQMVIRDVTKRKRLEKELIQSYLQIQNARNLTILGLAKLAEYRDQNTGPHLERIREYTKIMAWELAGQDKYKGIITPDYIEDLYHSSILHDIGKVGISDNILLKPGRLSQTEFEAIKQHTVLGGKIIEEIESRTEGDSFLSLGKEIAYYHHEWWNGSGYPIGLKGEEIPVSARLVAVADTYDALTSHRCYKEAMSHETAKEIVVSLQDRQFDAAVVEAFLRHERTFDVYRISFRKK